MRASLRGGRDSRISNFFVKFSQPFFVINEWSFLGYFGCFPRFYIREGFSHVLYKKAFICSMTVLAIHMLIYIQWVFELSNVMHDIIQRVIWYIVYWVVRRPDYPPDLSCGGAFHVNILYFVSIFIFYILHTTLYIVGDEMQCMIFHVKGRIPRPAPADTRGETSASTSIPWSWWWWSTSSSISPWWT